jgi:hypothetical protein
MVPTAKKIYPEVVVFTYTIELGLSCQFDTTIRLEWFYHCVKTTFVMYKEICFEDIWKTCLRFSLKNG